MFEEVKLRAEAVQTEYQTSVEQVVADRSLSDIGKREQIEQLDAARVAKVEQIQEDARRLLDDELAKVGQEITDLRRSYVEEKRGILGDTVLVDLYRRRVQMMDEAELRDFFGSTVDGWERELARELIKVELTGRDTMTTSAVMLLQEIDDTPAGLRSLELRRRELSDPDTLLDRLDLQKYRSGVADRFGLNAAALKNIPVF